MKKYIMPEVACIKLDTDDLMIALSSSYADPNLGVEARRRNRLHKEDNEVENLDEFDDFDE